MVEFFEVDGNCLIATHARTRGFWLFSDHDWRSHMYRGWRLDSETILEPTKLILHKEYCE